MVSSSSRLAFAHRPLGLFRLFLAFLVLLQHFCADLAPAALAKLAAPYPVGDAAVLVFFALSGFVITEAIDRAYQDRPVSFITNRLLRIVPHFVLAVALSMVAHRLFQAVGGLVLWRSQPSFPAAAFDLKNIVVNFIGIVPLSDRFMGYNFLDITWAVRVEMAFYLAMAVCVAGGRLVRPLGGFAFAACVMLAANLPLYFLALEGRAPGMFSFVPFFAFGCSLYYAGNGRKLGWLMVLASVPGMTLQSLHRMLALGQGGTSSTALYTNLGILMVLLATMAGLASATIRRGRGFDRAAGDLSYPLYLYHEPVFVTLVAFMSGYSYLTFGAGIVLSVCAAAIFSGVLDPLVGRYRDRVRGVSLGGGALVETGAEQGKLSASLSGGVSVPRA